MTGRRNTVARSERLPLLQGGELYQNILFLTWGARNASLPPIGVLHHANQEILYLEWVIGE